MHWSVWAAVASFVVIRTSVFYSAFSLPAEDDEIQDCFSSQIRHEGQHHVASHPLLDVSTSKEPTMPVCTIHLLSLKTNWDQFRHAIQSSTPQPLILAKVIRWIITPTTLSKDSLIPANNLNEWDALLILPTSSPSLTPSLTALTHRQWSIQAGVPSALLSNFHSRNTQLLRPPPGSVPPLSGSLDNHPRVADSAQRLELTTELGQWIKSGESPAGAVSMLNLLAFRPGRSREEYAKYGKAFAESVGSRRGGVAKIVGKAIDGDGWDEVSFCFSKSLSPPASKQNHCCCWVFPF